MRCALGAARYKKGPQLDARRRLCALERQRRALWRRVTGRGLRGLEQQYVALARELETVDLNAAAMIYCEVGQSLQKARGTRMQALEIFEVVRALCAANVRAWFGRAAHAPCGGGVREGRQDCRERSAK